MALDNLGAARGNEVMQQPMTDGLRHSGPQVPERDVTAMDAAHMPNPHKVMLKRVREGDSLLFRGFGYRVASRRRQGKLVILELESPDGEQATLIGHPKACQPLGQRDPRQPQQSPDVPAAFGGVEGRKA